MTVSEINNVLGMFAVPRLMSKRFLTTKAIRAKKKMKKAKIASHGRSKTDGIMSLMLFGPTLKSCVTAASGRFKYTEVF